MSVKQRMINYLTKAEGRNTFSVNQARSMFNVWNVAARIRELREDGWIIYTNVRSRADGSKVAVYRLGTPKRSFVQDAMYLGARY